jgi:hypothetical protein
LRAGGAGFVGVGNIADLRLTLSASAAAIGTAAANSGSAADFRTNRTGATATSLNNSFHIATVNTTTSPLPVSLLSFEAELVNDQVLLKWITTQEINNDFFTIEKSADLESFETVGNVRGQGNSKVRNAYSLTDPNPYSGRSYYRLKQTDYDGKFTYSKPQVILYEGVTSPTLEVFPNPSEGRELTISIKGLKDISTIPIEIYNLQGQKLYQIFLNEDGQKFLNLNTILSPGTYILKAGPTLQLTCKIVVN